MIIDIHTHIFNQQTWTSYRQKASQKINKVVALPWFNSKNPGWPDVESLLRFTSQEPEIYAVGAIDINANLNQQLQQHEALLYEKRIVGIKLYLGYQHFTAADPRVVPIAKLCGKYNRPLIFHSGDFYDPLRIALLKYSHPIHVDELAKAVPETKIVISHFGFPYLLETAMVVAKNSNVYTDISGTIDNTGDQEAVEPLTQQYIKDLQLVFNYYPGVKYKTMFGTDYLGEDTPLNQVEPYINVINSLMNPEQQLYAFQKLAQEIYFSV